jgi:hypothetical protein
MNTQQLECEHCHTTFTPTRHPKLRWGAAAAGFIAGGAITGSVFSGLLVGGLAYAGAALYDDYQGRTCPSCHAHVARSQRVARDVAPPTVEAEPIVTTH